MPTFIPAGTRELPPDVAEKLEGGPRPEAPRYQRGLIVLHRMSAARERTIRLSFGGVGVALGVAVSHFAPLLVALVVAGIGVALVLLQAAIWMNYLKESKSIIKKIDDGIKIIEPRERGTKLPESEPA